MKSNVPNTYVLQKILKFQEKYNRAYMNGISNRNELHPFSCELRVRSDIARSKIYRCVYYIYIIYTK